MTVFLPLGTPNIFADFCQKSWEYPQIFSDFDQKIWNFREKKSRFFSDFFSKYSKFSRKNLRFFRIFCQKNGGTPKNFEKNLQQNLGVLEVEKTAILVGAIGTYLRR